MRKAYFIEVNEHYNNKTNELEYTDYLYMYRGQEYTVTELPGDDKLTMRQKHEESQKFIDDMIETWRNPKKLILNKRKDQGVYYGVWHQGYDNN